MSEIQSLKAIADFYRCSYKNVVLADFFTENFKKRKFLNRKGRFLSVLLKIEPYYEMRIYHISKNKIHRIVFFKKATSKQIYNKNSVSITNFYKLVLIEILQCFEFIDKFGLEQISHSKIQNRILNRKRIKKWVVR